MPSRRAFLNRLALAVPAAGLRQAAPVASTGCSVNARVSLDGLWLSHAPPESRRRRKSMRAGWPPLLQPGQETSVTIPFQEKTTVRVQLDLMRPTAFSAHTVSHSFSHKMEWRP